MMKPESKQRCQLLLNEERKDQGQQADQFLTQNFSFYSFGKKDDPPIQSEIETDYESLNNQQDCSSQDTCEFGVQKNVKLCCRTYFTQNQIISQPQSDTSIYLFYQFPWSEKKNLQIQKIICGFLNSNGGFMYIGIEESKEQKRFKIIGSIYSQTQKQQIYKIMRTNSQAIEPNILKSRKLKVLFVPVKSAFYPFLFMSGRYILKIIVEPGTKDEVYTINCDNGDIYMCMKINKQLITYDPKREIRQILAIQKQKLSENLGEPRKKYKYECFTPEQGIKLFDKQKFNSKPTTQPLLRQQFKKQKKIYKAQSNQKKYQHLLKFTNSLTQFEEVEIKNFVKFIETIKFQYNRMFVFLGFSKNKLECIFKEEKIGEFSCYQFFDVLIYIFNKEVKDSLLKAAFSIAIVNQNNFPSPKVDRTDYQSGTILNRTNNNNSKNFQETKLSVQSYSKKSFQEILNHQQNSNSLSQSSQCTSKTPQKLILKLTNKIRIFKYRHLSYKDRQAIKRMIQSVINLSAKKCPIRNPFSNSENQLPKIKQFQFMNVYYSLIAFLEIRRLNCKVIFV